MTLLSKKLIFWTPRVLSIAFIAFLGLFALDVFGEGYGFWETLLGLLIHLIPNFILIMVLILAWRWEWIGAAAFAAGGVFYMIQVLPRSMPAAVKLSWILPISGPAFIIAALFLLNWIKHDTLRAR